MKSAVFDYVVPKTVAEAATSLAAEGITTAAIAGGQSLVPMLNLRVAVLDLLVDIGRLDDLKESGKTAKGIRIGALTTHADIEDGKIADPFGGLLRKVASGISYRAVRNYGTIGGSVALADPAADWPVCLLALGADVQVATRNGARSQPINDFIQGQYATSLEKDEIIVGFDVPGPGSRPRWGLSKVVRKSGAFASSIAIVVEPDNGKTVSVVLGAAGPRPYQLSMIAGRITSGETSEDVLRDAITQDLTAHLPQIDPYLKRLHASTILRAVREMRNQ